MWCGLFLRRLLSLPGRLSNTPLGVVRACPGSLRLRSLFFPLCWFEDDLPSSETTPLISTFDEAPSEGELLPRLLSTFCTYFFAASSAFLAASSSFRFRRASSVIILVFFATLHTSSARCPFLGVHVQHTMHHPPKLVAVRCWHLWIFAFADLLEQSVQAQAFLFKGDLRTASS